MRRPLGGKGGRTIAARIAKRTQGGNSHEVSKRWLGSQRSWPNLRTWSFDAILCCVRTSVLSRFRYAVSSSSFLCRAASTRLSFSPACSLKTQCPLKIKTCDKKTAKGRISAFSLAEEKQSQILIQDTRSLWRDLVSGNPCSSKGRAPDVELFPPILLQVNGFLIYIPEG